MIRKVTRGGDVKALLGYLFGPGHQTEENPRPHVDPRVIGAWDETLVGVQGRVMGERTELARLLEQPTKLLLERPEKWVWHCSLRAAPQDRVLDDGEWREVCETVLAYTGLAGPDDFGGVRWLAVRHADDHVHLVVTLARQDGGRAAISNDYFKVAAAALEVEVRFGLTRTAPSDKTARVGLSRVELELAKRHDAVPVRVTLRREVRTAVAGASGPDEFFERLRSSGCLVRVRYSEHIPGEVTGYAVAWPAGPSMGIWYSGSKLGTDLSWGRVQQRFISDTGGGGGAVSAAEHVRRAVTDGVNALSPDVVGAGADVLWAVARAVEGVRGIGPLHDAAAGFQRGVLEPWPKPVAPTPEGNSLRAAARTISGLGRLTHDQPELAGLLAVMGVLVEAVAVLREQQQRHAQAAAVNTAVRVLQAFTPPLLSDPRGVVAGGRPASRRSQSTRSR